MSSQGSAILRFSLLFLFVGVIIAFFASYLATVFNLMNFGIGTLQSADFNNVFVAIIGYFGWFLDVLFINGSAGYSTLVTAPTVVLGSFTWVFNLVRFIFGLLIVILIASLVFGRMTD